MTDFEKWQQELDEAAQRSVEAEPNADTTGPLSAEDQAVHDLCAQFSQADLLAETAPAETTPELAAPPQRSAIANSTLSFKREIVGCEDVEQAYQQLLDIADELSEELKVRGWSDTKQFVEAHLEPLEVAHNTGNLAILASSLCKGLGRFKLGLEGSASMAYKTQTTVADVGELLLLTALAAHELRLALTHAYDC